MVPWEEHMEEAHERKKLKYDDLLEQCQSYLWKASCLPIEVGTRGITERSLCKALSGPQKVVQLTQYPVQLKRQQNGYG